MSFIVSSTREADEREVISFLFDFLHAAEPRIPIHQRFVPEVDGILSQLLDEQVMTGPVGRWGPLVEAVEWHSVGHPRGRCYSLPLLRFFGYLGEALQIGGEATVPRSAVIELLLNFHREAKAFFRLRNRNDEERWIETTPLGEKVMGRSMKFELAGPPLHSIDGLPREAFDHALGMVNEESA